MQFSTNVALVNIGIVQIVIGRFSSESCIRVCRVPCVFLMSYWSLSLSLLNYMPYILSCLTCFVSYVPSCITYLVAYVLLRLTCLVFYMPQVLRAIRALVPHVPRALRILVSHVSYVLLYPTCLVPCVFSGCSYLELYVLWCSSSLTCFRCFKPNTFLYIWCLVAFLPYASCAFSALTI